MALIFLAAACASAPAQSTGSPNDAPTARDLDLYVTDSFNGAGLMAVDPLTLQDRSATPLLEIAPTAANNSWTVASSDGGTIAFAPSPLAFAADSSTLATWKYGIQYDGMCAGICGGFGIMPMLGTPLTLNSVYSIGAPGALRFATHPNNFV